MARANFGITPSEYNIPTTIEGSNDCLVGELEIDFLERISI
jgi:hypothetical protein